MAISVVLSLLVFFTVYQSCKYLFFDIVSNSNTVEGLVTIHNVVGLLRAVPTCILRFTWSIECCIDFKVYYICPIYVNAHEGP